MEQLVRVLIVDDQPRARRSMLALLGTFQVGPQKSETVVEVVGEAEDGEEAVRLAEAVHPDVVLMDAQMPVMNGLEATRAIKGLRPSTRVVVLTMYKELEEEALAAGADVFLIKGCRCEELREAILSASPRAALLHFKAARAETTGAAQDADAPSDSAENEPTVPAGENAKNPDETAEASEPQAAEGSIR